MKAMKWKHWSVVGGAALVSAMAATAQAGVESQNFDSAAGAAAAGWAGNLNHQAEDLDTIPITRPTDFDWSNTNIAGGAAAGEVGGTFARVENSYFADETIGTISLESVLTASGTFTLQSVGNAPSQDQRLFLGWFKSPPTGPGGVNDALVAGISMRSQASNDDPSMFRIGAAIGTNAPQGNQRNGGAIVTNFNGEPNYAPYDIPISFTMTWHPTGTGLHAGETGNGEIYVQFTWTDPVDGDQVLDSWKNNLGGAPKDFAQYQDWDRFGIVTQNTKDDTYGAVVWFDDLTYTSNVPEPTAMALLALGGALVCGRRRHDA